MLMVLSMKAIGKMISKMETELNSGQTELNIKEITFKGKKKATECSSGRMDLIMKEIF